MLGDFDIKFVLTTIRNPQTNALVEWVHQVILNMLVTKDLDNKFFHYLYPWGENLAYKAWAMKASYNWTIHDTPDQDVFGIDMKFNLTSVVDWWFITTGKQRQVEIDNFR